MPVSFHDEAHIMSISYCNAHVVVKGKPLCLLINANVQDSVTNILTQLMFHLHFICTSVCIFGLGSNNERVKKMYLYPFRCRCLQSDVM